MDEGAEGLRPRPRKCWTSDPQLSDLANVLRRPVELTASKEIFNLSSALIFSPLPAMPLRTDAVRCDRGWKNAGSPWLKIP